MSTNPWGTPPPRRVQAGRAPATTIAMQGRTKGSSTEVSSQYRCSKCAICYDVPHGDKANCPLCQAEKEAKKLALQLQEASETIRNLQNQMKALHSQVDHVMAIREALAIVSPEDMAWLKGVMYRYREDKTLSLMAVNTLRVRPGARRTQAQLRLKNAFMLVERGKDNEEYEPTSPGGMAIVGYFDEITRELGSKQAMAYLLRALSQVLTGGRM